MKKLFLFVAGLLFLPSLSFAAIAFDSATNGGFVSGSDTLTFSHTVSGTNTFLAVSCQAAYQSDILTGITYNGVSMVLAAKIQRPNDRFTYLFTLMNPTIGTHDVVASASSASDFMTCTASSYTGVRQTGQPTGVATIAAVGSNPNINVTTTEDNSWVIGSLITEAQLMTPDTNTTLRTSNPDAIFGDTNGAKSPAGTYSIGVVGGPTNYALIGAAIAPADGIPPPSQITGSGTANRLAKFITGTSIGNALFSDDGTDTTLTSGNLFLQIGSAIDSVTNGVLNFGTTLATTMNFGRTGQKMIINSDVGIGTNTPAEKLDVNGGIFSNFIHLLAGGLGIDTDTAGSLAIGATNASDVQVGHSGITTTVPGTLSVGTLATAANCNSSVSPAVCGSAPAGSVALSTGGTTLVVNTTAVTANSQIFIQEDPSLGLRLGLTCNTSGMARSYTVSVRNPGTSFIIKSSNAPVVNKACLSYWVVN